MRESCVFRKTSIVLIMRIEIENCFACDYVPQCHLQLPSVSLVNMADVMPPPKPRTNADFRKLLETPRSERLPDLGAQGGQARKQHSNKQQQPKKARPYKPKAQAEEKADPEEPQYRCNSLPEASSGRCIGLCVSQSVLSLHRLFQCQPLSLVLHTCIVTLPASAEQRLR